MKYSWGVRVMWSTEENKTANMNSNRAKIYRKKEEESGKEKNDVG